MKRRVKAWAQTCLGNRGREHVAIGMMYWTRAEARTTAVDGQVVIPCVIEYDDGKKPKAKKGEKP